MAACLAHAFLGHASIGPAPTVEKANGFGDKVLPILVRHCYDCHGDGSSKGGVAFDGAAGKTLTADRGETSQPN
ncbi:MAG: hypothetical protein SGI86_12220 [Deltaproteobacteria bacterium]|nr:hypothetical protein [Deltaproteobacteria bacterium]